MGTHPPSSGPRFPPISRETAEEWPGRRDVRGPSPQSCRVKDEWGEIWRQHPAMGNRSRMLKQAKTARKTEDFGIIGRILLGIKLCISQFFNHDGGWKIRWFDRMMIALRMKLSPKMIYKHQIALVLTIKLLRFFFSNRYQKMKNWSWVTKKSDSSKPFLMLCVI